MSFVESDRVRGLLERAGLGGLQPRTQQAVLVLAAIIIALGVWRFWPSAPTPEVAFDEGVTTSSSPLVGSAEVSGTATTDIVVHVVGAVMCPGVYSLAPGSRVVDAIEAAGGGLGNAALGSLNLARILADGEQVCVLTTDEVAAGAAPPGAAESAQGGGASAGGSVDINHASVAELDELPGIGPSTAQKIVDDREANGPFATPEDLMRVPGIGAAKYDALKDLVTCG